MNTTYNHSSSYVEWSAILAGAVLACAISLVLLQFGSGLGLSVADTLRYDGEHRLWRVVVAGLWLLWVQLMASMAGGYLAGRMRAPVTGAHPHESEMRDGAHGLLVWAASTLVAVAVASIGAFMAALAAKHGVVTNEAAEVPEEYARRAGIILGFSVAASSIVSAVAAWGMGTVGGDHRDRGSDVSRYISFRRTR